MAEGWIDEAINHVMQERHQNAVKALRALVGFKSTSRDWKTEFQRWALESDMYSDDDEENAPFFTESFLYNLLDKDEARSLLGVLHQLCTALGVDLDELVRKGEEAK